nr:polysaccharide biosynthesis C-terminal domain-containing protein [PVC group bacterium]
GAGEVAVFGATIQLVVLSGFPLLIAMGTVAPNISALVARKNSHDLNLLLRTTAQIQFAASLAITFGILILGRFALQIVYGDFYKVGVLPMIILAFGYCFNAWTGLPGLLLNMSGHQKVSMTCGIIAVSLGIATSLLLVPQIGITGAAIGSSAGIIAQNLLMLLYCRISFRINTWANISMDSIRRIHRTLIFRKGNFSRF